MYVCVSECECEMCAHEIRGQHLHLLNSSSHYHETGFSLNLHGTDSAKPAVHQAPRNLCLCLFSTVKFIHSDVNDVNSSFASCPLPVLYIWGLRIELRSVQQELKQKQFPSTFYMPYFPLFILCEKDSVEVLNAG